ncbi:MAG: hypothetical protein ACOX6E_03410 [Syntrophomonadaceae bacterium]|jgi:hypothetical protein
MDNKLEVNNEKEKGSTSEKCMEQEILELSDEEYYQLVVSQTY